MFLALFQNKLVKLKVKASPEESGFSTCALDDFTMSPVSRSAVEVSLLTVSATTALSPRQDHVALLKKCVSKATRHTAFFFFSYLPVDVTPSLGSLTPKSVL